MTERALQITTQQAQRVRAQHPIMDDGGEGGWRGWVDGREAVFYRLGYSARGRPSSSLLGYFFFFFMRSSSRPSAARDLFTQLRCLYLNVS